MQLSDRLKCTADYVSKGNISADIGCDHAYTSIYLVENRSVPHVYATDVNEGPVRRAEHNVRMYGLEDRITVILSNGLKKLCPEYGIETVLISGMGGNLIIDILSEADISHNTYSELVLQPQSDVYKVRHFLHENAYRIEAEKVGG